jgi:2-polyprenyl-3-methyl-5-hydroxy-6-metoxy-1,4-benzoquinol methylase
MQAPLVTPLVTPPAHDIDAFSERLLELINGGALALMISIGHRTGLFDTLAERPPTTCAELARAAGLHPRYVREWLGAMVVGGIVEHQVGITNELGTYTLPDAHAASLCRNASAANLAVFTQYIGLLGSVEDDIVDCFRHGGGVPYSKYPRFHEVMAEDSGQSVLPVLESEILPLIPGLVDRLRLGIEVLDLGCGRGRALLLLAERFPRSRFRGIDCSAEAIAWAREQADTRGLDNLAFEVVDAAALGREHVGQYDLITTFDAIHDQRDPAMVLANIASALAPGGTYLMQEIATSGHHHHDIGHPLGPTLYTISCMHCMTVSLAEGGAGLGATWGRELAMRMLGEAGLRAVEVRQLEHDLQNEYYVCRRSLDEQW